MKKKLTLSSACMNGIKTLRALIILAAVAQMSIGQPVPFSPSAANSGFSISISPSLVVIPPGGTADYTITVTVPSAAADLTFSITGLPPHATATIAMESASVYSLTITTSRLTPQGQYDFTVTATSGEMSASASARLDVLLAAG